jgi:NADPH:quinone reductase-like Zn-dependent oxidoreductase
VNIFAVQFAKAAGATVISTTSSAEKAESLKKLGSDHIINYKETPNCGEKAAQWTPNGEGVNYVIELGGQPHNVPIPQSRQDRWHYIHYWLPWWNSPKFMEALSNLCNVRGIIVGSRDQFEAMNRAIEVNKIKPAVDQKIFTLDQAKE